MLLKPDEEDLWSDILNDVSTASTNKDKKCLLILGDEFVGKTVVINRLRRLEGNVTKAGLGLEYSYLDIRVRVSWSCGLLGIARLLELSWSCGSRRVLHTLE